MIQLSHPYVTTGKTIALTIWTFVRKMMPLLFNTLSIFVLIHCLYLTSLVAQTVKCQPTLRETWGQSLGQDDLLEKEMATHSSILTWKNPIDGGA